MSERPMTVPPEALADGAAERAELVMLLPEGLNIEDPLQSWPLQFLRFIARLPHEYDTWLGHWHTVPNGDPALPLAEDTVLAGAMVAPFVRLPNEFATLSRGNGERIAFMALVCLTADELDLKLAKGTGALTDLMDAAGVSELLDPGRASLVSARRRWPGKR